MLDLNQERDAVSRSLSDEAWIEAVNQSQTPHAREIREQHVHRILCQRRDGHPVDRCRRRSPARAKGETDIIYPRKMTDETERPESAVINVPSLPEVISDQLRTDITRGVYKPGPVRIGALAERFGVSSMPVREALRRLEAEGLISFQRNRQIIINALSVDEVEEVFEIRTQLEPFALRRAVVRLQHDAEALQALDKLILRMDEAVDNPDPWRTINMEFHARLYRGAGMPRLEAMIASLWAIIESYIRFYLQIAADVELAQQQHKEMLALVRSGDGDAAASMLVAHIALSRDGLINAMRAQPDEIARDSTPVGT